MNKVQTPFNPECSVIRHHQNPLESTLMDIVAVLTIVNMLMMRECEVISRNMY
jgi:hypothetical protein